MLVVLQEDLSGLTFLLNPLTLIFLLVMRNGLVSFPRSLPSESLMANLQVLAPTETVKAKAHRLDETDPLLKGFLFEFITAGQSTGLCAHRAGY